MERKPMENPFKVLEAALGDQIRNAAPGAKGEEARRTAVMAAAGLAILERFITAIEMIGMAHQTSRGAMPSGEGRFADQNIPAGIGVVLGQDGKVHRVGDASGWFVGFTTEDVRGGAIITVSPAGEITERKAPYPLEGI
jgi:hypothetical protein